MSVAADIEGLLRIVDDELKPALSTRVDIHTFAEKIAANATVFSTYMDGRMIGFISIYCNNVRDKAAYLPMMAVEKEYRRSGTGSLLLDLSISYLKSIGFKTFRLEVFKSNKRALAMYLSHGFKTIDEGESSYFMELVLGG